MEKSCKNPWAPWTPGEKNCGPQEKKAAPARQPALVFIRGSTFFQGPQGPRRQVFGSKAGPKLRNSFCLTIWAPGALPNRFAFKFHANHTYFHCFWGYVFFFSQVLRIEKLA